MNRRYFWNLPATSLNMLSFAFGIFVVCLGIRVARSPELALRAANVQLNVSSSARQLRSVSQELEEQLLIIEAKDEAYQELLSVYQRSLKGNKKFSQLQDAIENIEQLPEIENVEELTQKVEQVESKIDAISPSE